MVALAVAGLLVVTPRRVHADAMARTLEAGFGVRRAVAATGHPDAISRVIAQRPHAVLVDFEIEDLVACLRAVRRAAPSVPIVVYGVGCVEGAGERLIHAAQAGVSSFVDDEQQLEGLVPVLELALQGQPYCSPRVAGVLLHALQLIRDLPLPQDVDAGRAGAVLSQRERIVAELVVSGLTNRQIANRLVVSEATVKSHVHAILHKLGIHRREEVRMWFGPGRAPAPAPVPQLPLRLADAAPPLMGGALHPSDRSPSILPAPSWP